MRKSVWLLIVFISLSVSAQTYNELSEQALAWAEQDSLQRAEEVFRQVLKLEPANPHNALIFSNIGSLQQRMGKHVEAIESYTLALNIAPRMVSILLNRASSYLETGMLDRAYIDYCEVLDLDRENAEAFLMRAYIYVTRRDYHAARMDYNRLLLIDSDSYSGKLGLAILNQKEGKFKEALEIVGGMINEYPEDPLLYLTRAGIEQEMDQLELALIDLKEAIRLNPKFADAYLIRGEVYLAQKKKTLAKADFEKAISLGASTADIRELLRQCK